MDHAWLDSLSEDWVSQPASDTSVAQLPPLTDGSTKVQTRDFSSRRLQRGAGVGSPSSPINDRSFNILSERSTNEILASRTRNQSKLSREIRRSPGPENQRVISTTSNASVIHNTVNQQASPDKFDGQTPEWKRRLLHGNMAYGEQRDLFFSAATGLQDMFKPPASPGNDTAYSEAPAHNTTLPSSPPAYPQRVISGDIEDSGSLDGMDDYEQQHPNDISPSPSPRRQPRGMSYRLNFDESGLASDDTFNLVQRGSPRAGDIDEIYRDESCLTVDEQQGSRKVSGQSDTRNEDFSPIIIGKHSDQDGRVDFAPIEIHVDQLKHKLERLRINQMLLDSQMPTEDILGQGDDVVESENDHTGWAQQAVNINTRRGGRSAEGSFRYRDLSPSMGIDTSEMLPEESLQASTPKQFPTLRTETINSNRSPSLPRAPFPSPEKKSGPFLGRPTAGGSPLKLFGPYDTFTNQTLLRRISQFEESTSSSNSRPSVGSVTPNEHSPSRTQHAFVANSVEVSTGRDATSRRLSQFGEGDLEGYEFNSDASLASMERPAMYGHNRLGSVALSSPSTRRDPQSRESSPVDDSEMLTRRKRDGHHIKPTMDGQKPELSQGNTNTERSPMIPDLATTPRRDAGSEGKRPRTSPSKDPTPKRRRTLHRSDIAYGWGEEGSPAARDYVTSVMGKKHKNTRPGEFELASPEILAMRTILRPRSPTPTQRSSESKARQSPGYFDLQRGSPGSTRSPVRAMRAEDSPMLRNAPMETDRKPSIRTQDFVDQAAQIMAMIRSQVRPQGLASVEESEAEGDKPSPDMTEGSYLDSTNEPFDRPPSRDGAPMPRLSRQQEDPDVLSRLKKYQEASDMGDIISSSMRSLGLAKDAVRSAKESKEQTPGAGHVDIALPLNDGEDFVSDIPNIRLSTAPSYERPVSRDYHSSSSENNTNGSYPTNSSRGSDSRKVIMPESVSHLIPDRVGSMYLDKHNNIWVKKKDEPTEPAPEVSVSDDSEDDPFASIPDLTVDMTREMQNLKMATERKQGLAGGLSQPGSPANSSNPVKNGNGPNFTSISPDQLKMEMLHQFGQRSPSLSLLDGADDEAKRADDSSGLPVMEQLAGTRRRNLTIAFSSPIASIIQEVVAEDLDSIDEDDIVDTGGPTSSNLTNSGLRPAMKSQTRDFAKADSQRPGTAFVPRPVSRIDEQDEDSTVEMPYDDQRQVSIVGETSIVSHKTPNARNSSLSFFINRTPGAQALSVRGDESGLIGQNVGKLSLSPLSEFTLNNSDQSFGFEVSYVMGPRHMETGDGSKRVMSMTIRELVDKLSEAEPYEPFWEDMSELTLCDKRLTSLHMLDEFCGRLVNLDASNNKLGHLEGVPASVRQLKANHNMLTELTSWDHLMNLQYIDISGNEVTSLSALKNLVHLRSVKADGNHLASLDGLDGHDGLLSLRARDNDIEEIDFSSTRLDRLADLDLGGNRISTVRNLDKCTSLSRLKLERNELRTFAPKKANKALRVLDISDNCLSSLDVSAFPGLHTLHADRNCISSVVGFQRCRRLDSLSLREQHGEEPLDMTFLSAAYEVRKLFLSGNFMGSFEPQVDFLNLQLLDLANCGLRELPRMMGQLMPNLRTLNINFNAVSDLKPLLFVPRVKKLLAAGNRLADSTAVTELLTEFPHLTQLDLRDNPVTQGFYAPLQVLVTTDHKTHVDPFVLPDADRDRDETYGRRLDEATKLRRRLHQVVFAASCRRLRKLDGLALDRHSIMARDEVLQILIGDGLLPEIGAASVPDAKQPISPQGEQKVLGKKEDT